MPGVLIDRVADENTQRNFERISAAFESMQGDPLRYAKKSQGVVSGFAYLKQPISDTTAILQKSGLSIRIATPGVYVFEFIVFFRTAATTTGIGLSINGPINSLLRFGAMIHESATAFRNGVGEAYDATTLGTAVAVANSTRHAVIDGIVVAKSPGDLMLMFRTEVAASAAMLMPGTFGMAWRAE
jgi:hypothetical protein